jgi:hypothetical protein
MYNRSGPKFVSEGILNRYYVCEVRFVITSVTRFVSDIYTGSAYYLLAAGVQSDPQLFLYRGIS